MKKFLIITLILACITLSINFSENINAQDYLIYDEYYGGIVKEEIETSAYGKIEYYPVYENNKSAFDKMLGENSIVFDIMNAHLKFELNVENIMIFIRDKSDIEFESEVDRENFMLMLSDLNTQELSELFKNDILEGSNDIYIIDDEGSVKINFEGVNQSMMANLIYSSLTEEELKTYEQQIENILYFYDIYENDELNNNINSILYSRSSVNNKKDQLLYALPYNSEFITNNLNAPSMRNTRSVYSLSKARDYASEYATKVNSVYGSAGLWKDCTNFVSQILNKSGVRQVNSSSEYEGWWHKSYYVTIRGHLVKRHKYSVSWSNADTFARYMGVGYETKSFYYFSRNIKAGDFIAYDRGSDGDWDHTAFVTYTSSTTYNYTNRFGNRSTYLNFKVAQHSDSYHAWVSSSDNNWESLDKGGHTYGRVRR